MKIGIEGSDIPADVREIIRLQNQCIRRLETTVAQLVEVLNASGALPGAAADAVSRYADGSGIQKLIMNLISASSWDTDEQKWERLDEPDWVWEDLREREQLDAWHNG